MKWGGIVLLLGAGTALGFYKAYGFQKRTSDIIMLQNAFRLLILIPASTEWWMAR